MPYKNHSTINLSTDLKDYLDSKKPAGSSWVYFLHYLLEFWLQNNKLLDENK
jgi:hypothetical protein